MTNGRTTIPKYIRNLLEIYPGDKVIIEVKDNEILLRKDKKN